MIARGLDMNHSLRRGLVLAGGVGLWLAACAGPETRPAVAVENVPETKGAYTDYVSDRLDYWREQAREVPENERDRLATAVRDASMTLQQLQQADEYNWRSYRERMEDALANVQRLHREARVSR